MTELTRHGFVADLSEILRAGAEFRRVLATTERTQLVVMTLQAGEEIGAETHDGIDQILVVLEGSGSAVIDGEATRIARGAAVVVPAGVRHNVIAADAGPLQLVTVYGPPDHAPGTVHRTKAEAEADEHDEPPAG